MPKYKMVVWMESADRGTCVVEAKDEESAQEAVREIIWSGDHGIITWERNADGDLSIEVADDLPPDAEADFTFEDEDEEEDADEEA